MQATAIAQHIDELAASHDAAGLIALLHETYDGYAGKGSNEVMRLKGYAIAAFAKTGLPEAALPFVLDEIQNGMNAYTVAAAAMSIRYMAARDLSVLPYLFTAAYGAVHMEDAVSFDTFKPQYPLKEYTTPLTEILRTIQWLQPADKTTLEWLETFQEEQHTSLSKDVRNLLAQTIEFTANNISKEKSTDCCERTEIARPIFTSRKRLKKKVQQQVHFEDQEGTVRSFSELFSDNYTVAIFFYTRCDNPNKCSLSVSRFTQLQHLLEERGMKDINLAGISYDADHDIPDRLKTYGTNRGFHFDVQNRFFRVASGYDVLRSYLQLGVNYTGSIINHHSIELYIFDREGSLVMAQTRMQWKPEEIADALLSLQENGVAKEKLSARQVLRISGNVLSGLVIAFFPKCPMCWAGYMSLFGAIGLESVPYTPEVFFIVLAGLLFNLFLHYRLSRKRHRMGAFFINLTGVALVLSGYLLKQQTLSYTGITLLLLSSLFINLSQRLLQQLSAGMRLLVGRAAH